MELLFPNLYRITMKSGKLTVFCSSRACLPIGSLFVLISTTFGSVQKKNWKRKTLTQLKQQPNKLKVTYAIRGIEAKSSQVRGPTTFRRYWQTDGITKWWTHSATWGGVGFNFPRDEKVDEKSGNVEIHCVLIHPYFFYNGGIWWCYVHEARGNTDGIWFTNSQCGISHTESWNIYISTPKRIDSLILK